MPPLLRTLRLRDLFLLFVGSVIGSGIFLTPGLILRQLDGSVGFSLLVWIVGGVLSLLGALTYAELAATNPEAGGLYCFIRDGFGRVSAFLYGWCLFLVIASGSVAALARAFTEHLAEIIPLSPLGKTVLSVVMIAVVTAVNVWGTRKSSNLQNWTTLVKVGIIVVLSAILLSLGRHAGDLPPALGSSQHGLGLLSNFGLAMIAVLWAYEGWQFGTYSAGEVVDPQKAFPRAFLFGSLTLAGLYVVAVIAYLVALGPAGATASNTIAATSIESYRLLSSLTKAARRRMSTPAPDESGTRPNTRAPPLVGFVMPSRIFIAVVLPAPLRPRNPKIEPAGTCRFSPCRASTTS